MEKAVEKYGFTGAMIGTREAATDHGEVYNAGEHVRALADL